MTDLQKKANLNGLQSCTAKVGDISIHYWRGGDPEGRPVLLWHGFLSTSYAWREVVPLLISDGYSILVPDMRGFGDTDKPAGEDGYDGRALANEFRALVQQTKFANGKPLIIAAHDMGAPPALLWAADYPDEIEALLYIEAPVMLSEILTKIIVYTQEAAKKGSMWWWLLPLAPDVPETLVVGKERAFLSWFFNHATVNKDAIQPAAIDEYLRTFMGREGVLGAMGVYRAAFKTIDQTEPLARKKIRIPVVALGGKSGLGESVLNMVSKVAENVTGATIENCGHFLPEERPEEVLRFFRALSANK
jgi:pimeloyl-ACP methyl ester carboxylesterase